MNNVQITAAESIGVEGRGGYYQEAGALRDMIQNHLLQIMATIAMEPSATFQPDAVRDERAKLLRSIRIMKPDEVLANSVAGQYGPARIGGEDVPGFRQEPGVDPDAQTDTYAAVTFFVDNWRWAGVPFYIRTGKRLPKRVTEIAIQFNAAPHAVFGDNGDGTTPNLLILRIQPEEGISLRFLSKRPGAGMNLRPVSMDFNYGSSFGERSPTAYETLLLDAMMGDATLYTRQDMVEASWAVVEPIMQVWDDAQVRFSELRGGHLGSESRGRDAGAPRPHVEKTVSATIQPETILRELSDLWVSLGKEADPGQASGVLRACAMTLIAVAEEAEDPSDVWSVMATLMPEHPSRAIVIRFRQSEARELSARVFSQCWMPFGHRRQICCEQIEISASDASLPDLPAVIVPLAVSDLPVILWCRGCASFRAAGFRASWLRLRTSWCSIRRRSLTLPEFCSGWPSVRGPNRLWAIWPGRG